MKLSLIALITLLISCQNPIFQNNENLNQTLEPEKNIGDITLDYVLKPNPTDSTCISAREKAKEDIMNENITFYFSEQYPQTRHSKELDSLCSTLNLNFYHDNSIICYVPSGQTITCHENYMDYYISKEYGKKFKNSLHEKADSIYFEKVITNNISVHPWLCDQHPRIAKISKEGYSYSYDTRYNFYINLNNLQIPIDSSEMIPSGLYEQFELSIDIHKTGIAQNFRFTNTGIHGQSVPERQRNTLLTIATNYLNEKHPKWEAGTIKNTPVNVKDINVFVTFRK